MTLTNGEVRENRIVELTKGALIAWLPGEAGAKPFGQLWRWELQPLDQTHTRVPHTYDWSQLTDEKRMVRARGTIADKLAASIERLADLAKA